ncbi:MAG: universal stress protein [Candidatus Natronoplasma sp.]
MYRRVILPTDGSEESMKAVKEGMKLASFLDVPATAIHVIEMGDLYIPEDMEKSLKRSGEKILEEVEALADEMGVELETKIFKGTPYKRISGYAEEDDVIYISSHGSSGFKELFLGSTTNRLLKHAKCTVAMVKGTPGEVDKSKV